MSDLLKKALEKIELENTQLGDKSIAREAFNIYESFLNQFPGFLGDGSSTREALNGYREAQQQGLRNVYRDYLGGLYNVNAVVAPGVPPPYTTATYSTAPSEFQYSFRTRQENAAQSVREQTKPEPVRKDVLIEAEPKRKIELE